MSNVRLKLPPKLIESARASQYANRERQGVRETEVKLKKKAKRQAEEEVKKKQLDKDKQPDGRRVGGQLEHEKREQYKIWTRRRKRSGVGFILVPSGQYTDNKLLLEAELDQDTIAFTRDDLPIHTPLDFMPKKKFSITSNTSGLSGVNTNLMLEPGVSSGEYSFTENRGSEENPEITTYTRKGSAYLSTLSHYSITQGPVTAFDDANQKYITANAQIPFSEAEFNWTADKTKQVTYEFILYLESGTRQGETRINSFLIPPGGPPENSGSLDPLLYTRSYYNEMSIRIQQGAGAFDYYEFQIRNHSVQYSNTSPSPYNWFNITENYFISAFDSPPSAGSVPPGRHHIALVYDFAEGSSTQIVRRTYLDGVLKNTFSGASNLNRGYRDLRISCVGYEIVVDYNGDFKQDIFGRWYYDLESVVTTYSPNVPKIWLQSFRFTPQALYKEDFTPPTTISDLAD